MSEENTLPAPPAVALGDLKKKMKLKGTVTRLELYGAFVNIGLEAPAVLHISQLGKRVNRVSDLLSVGEEVTVWVDKIDHGRGQITLTMIQPLAVEWSDLKEGQVYTGKIVRLEGFGAFIDIGAEKEGLAHVSELSHDYVKHPSEVIQVGEEVEVKVLGFDRKKKRINLSRKAMLESPEAKVEEMSLSELEYEEDEEPESFPTAMEIALRSAMHQEQPAKTKEKRRGNRQERDRRSRRAQEEIYMRTLSLAESDAE